MSEQPPRFSISQVSTLAASFADDVRTYAAAAHVNERRLPPRSRADRVLPGHGAPDLPALFGVLEDVGWEGSYDLEIISDNGAVSTPPSRCAFISCWSKRRVPAEAAGRRGET